MARHQKACKGGNKKKFTITTKSKSKSKADYINDPHAKPSIDYVTRLKRVEETLDVLGKHIPQTPSPFILTGKGAKLYLTQLKINLESAAKYVGQIIERMNQAEVEAVEEELRSKVILNACKARKEGVL